MKIVSKEDIIQRIQNNYPDAPFELLEYTKVTQPITVKCLSCGKELHSSSVQNFLNKQTLCTCLNPRSSDYKHNKNKELILKLCEDNPDIEWKSFSYRQNTKKYSVQVHCLLCGSDFEKDWESFMINQTCPYCQSKHNLNTAGFQTMLPAEYTLVSEYTGTENKVLIKHQCGFIWKIKPHIFVGKLAHGYIGCPHCNHKRSKGEQKIARFLERNNIKYYNEYIFPWSSNSKFRYDFYVPDYNLIIEYMGEQHYKEINFYHDTLEERQEYDQIKEKEAKEHSYNYLVIPFNKYQDIDTILHDWFNDYSARKQEISV